MRNLPILQTLALQSSEDLKPQDLHTNNTRDKEYVEIDIESEDIDLQYWLL